MEIGHIFAFLKKIKIIAFLGLFSFTAFVILTKTSLVYHKLSNVEKSQASRYNSTHWSEIDTFPVLPFREIKVFCWILTRKQNLLNRAIYIRDSWGKRCDKTLFFQSDKSNFSFPVIGLKIRQRKESKNTNIVKAIRAWRYVHQKYGNDYDFFVKVDDDVYVIVENLKLFLADKNPNEPAFFAHRTLLGNGEEPFDQAGSGLILSREALGRLIHQVILQHPKCLLEDKYGDAEDWKTAFCLKFVAGTRGGDTRDSLGRERIFPFRPGYHIDSKFPSWFMKDYEFEQKNMVQKGPNCCSFYPFAFHDIKGTSHLMMDYLFYNIRVNGERNQLFDPGLIDVEVNGRNDKILKDYDNSNNINIPILSHGSVKSGLAYPHHEHDNKPSNKKGSNVIDTEDSNSEITTMDGPEDYPTLLIDEGDQKISLEKRGMKHEGNLEMDLEKSEKVS